MPLMLLVGHSLPRSYPRYAFSQPSLEQVFLEFAHPAELSTDTEATGEAVVVVGRGNDAVPELALTPIATRSSMYEGFRPLEAERGGDSIA